ncbi:MAG: hypothetical protein K0U98_14860 [Deltaproteobacteria bacterium]|nr:hypothetical protein [Deltaproteobacteria bacterium]
MSTGTPASSEIDSQTLWSTFIGRYGGLLASYLRSHFIRLGMRTSVEELEEALQEAYFRLLAQSPAGAGPRIQRRREAEIRVYLRQVACSVVTDRWRHLHASKRGGGNTPHLQADRWPAFEELLDPRPSAEDRLLRREKCQLLVARYRGSSKVTKRRDLMILRMALVEGWTCHEIVERLDGSLRASSVSSVVARWRQRLAS